MIHILKVYVEMHIWSTYVVEFQIGLEKPRQITTKTKFILLSVGNY